MKKIISLISNNKIEFLSLVILGLISFYLRFTDLGFHHFYGDEVKTLFLRKDESAFDFLMEQRKGPVQFIMVWVVEKLVGFDEYFMRLPFAIFGLILLYVFYYFVRKTLNQDFKVSIFSTFLVSLNGIYIAFSRTAQYQMVYLVFGFLSLIFFHKYLNSEKKNLKIINFVLACLFFTLGLLTHYDVLFFLLPVLLIFNNYKKALLMFFCSAATSLLFYAPQIYFGFFGTNTAGYLAKRIVGKEYLPSFTPYTFLLYNPLYLYLVVLLILAILGYYLSSKEEKASLGKWFFIPFILLDFFVLVPGTHVHNYLFPLFIFAGIAFSKIKSKLAIPALVLFLTAVTLTEAQVFLPKFNLGYPFADSSLMGINVQKLNKGYSTPIYGFVYNRDWKEIAEFMKKQKRVPSFTTNENKVVAEYYLFGYSFTDYDPYKPAEYYIEITNSQEVEKVIPVEPLKYELIKSGNSYAIYKLKELGVKK